MREFSSPRAETPTVRMPRQGMDPTRQGSAQGGILTSSSTTGYLSHRGTGQEDKRVHLLLRNHIYREAVRFSKGSPGSCYDIFLNAPYPTDPTAMCTVPSKCSDFVDVANTVPPRFRWNGLVPLFMILVCDGICSGIALALEARSVHTVHIAFYAMCFIIWTLLAIPILQLQHALAQFFQGGPLRTYGLVHRRLWGVGIAVVNILILRAPHYLNSVGEGLLYFTDATMQKLPWAVAQETQEFCDSQWGQPLPRPESDYCLDILNNGTWVPDTLKPIQTYYKDKVLMVHPVSQSRFHWELAAACFIGACLVFAATVAGVRFLGQVASFTVVTLLFLLCVLTLNAFPIAGGLDALYLLLQRFDVSTFYSKHSWVDALVLVLRISSVIAGQHCVMPSYTRVGTNILFVSWVAGLSSIVVSAWTVALVYTFQGFVYSTVIEDTYKAIYSRAGIDDPTTLKALIQAQIHKAVGSTEFENFISRGVSEKTVHEFLYILFPWAMGRLPGGRLFLIIFYFCLTVAAGVGFAGVSLALVCAIQEVARFERTHPTFIKAFVSVVCFVISVPTFLLFFIETPSGQQPFGRYISFVVWISTFHLGAPLTGLCLLFGILCAWGHEKQSEYLPKYVIPLHWFFTIVGTTCTLYFLAHSSQSLNGYIAIFVGLIVSFGAPFLLAVIGLKTYKTNLWAIFVGDVEFVRAVLNKVLIGHNCVFRLRRFWGVALKYGCISWFITVMLTSRLFPSSWQKNKWTSYASSYALASELPVTLIVVIPILLLAIFPSIGRCFHPSPTNQWRMKDIVKKTDPKRGFKRLRIRFWEEYLSPQSLWTLGDATTFGKL